MINKVSVEGRVTINNSDQMRRRLRDALRAKPTQTTVDLSQATYMDTSGVATLLETVHAARRQGTRLVLSGLRGQPRYLLEETQFDLFFEIAKESSA